MAQKEEEGKDHSAFSLLLILCRHLFLFWVRGALGHPLTPLATATTCVTPLTRVAAAPARCSMMPVAAAWQPASRLAGVVHNCNKTPLS